MRLPDVVTLAVPAFVLLVLIGMVIVGRRRRHRYEPRGTLVSLALDSRRSWNTPSHRRVHHATNARYLDSNYAGVFIVRDRLFGSFEPERDDDRPRARLGYIARPPGRSHDDSRDTSQTIKQRWLGCAER